MPGATRSASAPQLCPRVPHLTWALQRRGQRQQGQERSESRGHHGSAGSSRRRLGRGLSGAGRKAALVWLSPRRRVFENAQLISRSASPAASSFRLGGCERGPPSYPPTPAQLSKSFPVLCPGAWLWQSRFWGCTSCPCAVGGTMGGEGAAGARAAPGDPQQLERRGKPPALRGRGGEPVQGCGTDTGWVSISRGEGSSGGTGLPFTPCSRWVCPTDSDSDSRRWGQHVQPALGTPAWGSSFPPNPWTCTYTRVRFHRSNLHLL